MKSFVVIGMGRFGSSIAKELYKHGNEVMVIDENEELIQDIADDVTHAVVGDAADEAVLRSLGLRNFDVAIIAIGEHPCDGFTKRTGYQIYFGKGAE